MTENKWPRVGTGVLIFKDGKVLLGKRKGGHGTGTWAFPGGRLEMNETWQENVHRETREEAGIEIENIQLVNVTNDIEEDRNNHYVTICVKADWKVGEVKLTEPDKFTEWGWFSLERLPEPLYPPTRNFLENGYNPLHL